MERAAKEEFPQRVEKYELVVVVVVVAGCVLEEKEKLRMGARGPC